MRTFIFIGILQVFVSLSTSMLMLNCASADGAQVDLDIVYAQSSRFWTTINNVKGVEGNLGLINQLLNQNYGTYQIGFSRFFVNVTRIDTGWQSSILKTAYFGSSADLIAYGNVANPVVPILHGDVVLSGEINEGFEGTIDSMALRTKWGGHFGEGYEKRINAVSTDLIQNIPTQNGQLTYVGLDAGVGRDFELPKDVTWKANGVASETIYQSAIDGTSNSYQSWKIKDDLVKKLGSVIFEQDSVSLETVLGPQPLPVDFLPRTWEYVDQLDSFPELGVMAGAGLAWNGSWGASSLLTLRAGFYGGYPGGQMLIQTGSFRASLESWGIEASSAYQTLGQRIWGADLGLRFRLCQRIDELAFKIAVAKKIRIFNGHTSKGGIVNGFANFIDKARCALIFPVLGNHGRKSDHASLRIIKIGDFKR